jgi:opacity protein-like surface antigen
MKILNLLAAGVLAVMATVGVAQAQTAPAGKVSGLYVGTNVGTNFKSTSDYQVGGVIGYHLTRNMAAEVTYDYNRVNRGGYNSQMVMGNVLYGRTIGNTTVMPYALAGVGMGWNGLGAKTNGDTLALYNVGAGVRVNLVGNLDLDTRYRYVGAFDQNAGTNHHMVTTGINYRF